MPEKQPVSASAEDSYFSVLILREKDLSKINEILRGFLDSGASLSFYFDCSDKITREYDSITDAKKYENQNERRITSLWIYGRSKSPERWVSIRIAGRRLSNVTISLKGPGMAVASCMKKIEEWLTEMRPWYARFASPTVYFFGPALVMLLFCFGIIAWKAVTGKMDNKPLEFTPQFLLTIIASGLFGVVSTVMLNAFHNWLFPVVVFAIGQGDEREKRLASWRSVVLGLIGLGLIVGIASSLVASFMFQALN